MELIGDNIDNPCYERFSAMEWPRDGSDNFSRFFDFFIDMDEFKILLLDYYDLPQYSINVALEMYMKMWNKSDQRISYTEFLLDQKKMYKKMWVHLDLKDKICLLDELLEGIYNCEDELE